MIVSSRAAVLWTGGKDCNLALYEAKMAGYNITHLVVFLLGEGKPKAHPLSLLSLQSEALNIPQLVISLTEPYKESYENAIAKLKTEYGIETLVTGDISEIHGDVNWITERSKSAGVNVFLPLWHLDREQVLKRLFSLNFNIIFSCVKEPWFGADWVGKQLNSDSLKDLREIKKLDLCGEQGEYHTLVLDGPGYNSEICIDSYIEQKKDEIMYMEIGSMTLKPKGIEIATE